MRRERDQEPDETEEISLEDTQESIGDSAEPAGAGPEVEYEEVDESGLPEFAEEPELDEEEFEGDEFDKDEYYEEGDDFYEDEEVDEEELTARSREPATPLAERVTAAWTVVLARVRAVDLPGRPDFDQKTVTGVAAILLASLAVGLGAYLLGRGSGDDVDAARLKGETAGKLSGALEGAARGYPAGFRKGRDRGFEKAYVRTYKVNYRRAFEQAGLDVPADKDIDVPEP